MTLVKCEKCGKDISDTADKCVHCGNELKEDLKCPDCGAKLKKDDKFCPKCGYKCEIKKEAIKETYCPKCGEKIEKNATFCGRCGKNLKEEVGNTKTPQERKKDTFALVGFILGLVSSIAWIIPLFGYPIAIIGIVFSAKSRGSEKTAFTYIGLYFSIIFLGVTFLNSVLGVLLSINETTYVDYIAKAIEYLR